MGCFHRAINAVLYRDMLVTTTNHLQPVAYYDFNFELESRQGFVKKNHTKNESF